MLIDIVLFNGFDELDAIAPWEVLKNAESMSADFRVRLVSKHGPEQITAAHGLKIFSEATLESDPRADLILVPGGGWVDRAPQGARHEAELGVIPVYLRKRSEEGAILASVCTGAMLLASAGLLRDRAAITHHSAIEELRSMGTQIVPARVVDDGNIISAGGVTSGLDLAIYLVERFGSSQLAHEIERRMEYERRGTVFSVAV